VSFGHVSGSVHLVRQLLNQRLQPIELGIAICGGHRATTASSKLVEIEQVAGLTIDDLEQLLALMLPLELGNPGLFGDGLQFVLGCIAFFLESVGVEAVIARFPAGRPGGVRAAR
jgi:hypothetical protein